MTGAKDVAVLGVGMHPWGKWGRNFVEYGIEAAHAALTDAGVQWRDVGFLAGADTIRNGYPGFIAGATMSQALGWKGNRIASQTTGSAEGRSFARPANSISRAKSAASNPRSGQRCCIAAARSSVPAQLSSSGPSGSPWSSADNARARQRWSMPHDKSRLSKS